MKISIILTALFLGCLGASIFLLVMCIQSANPFAIVSSALLVCLFTLLLACSSFVTAMIMVGRWESDNKEE